MTSQPVHLHAVPPLVEKAEEQTVAQRIKTLMAEARQLSTTSIQGLVHDLDALRKSADEIHQGGESYKSSWREEARQISEYCTGAAQRLERLLSTNTQ